MPTALRLEGTQGPVRGRLWVSGKGEEGCGNTDMPSGTVGRGGRRGEAGAGEDDEALIKEEKNIDDDLKSDLPDIDDIINDRS